MKTGEFAMTHYEKLPNDPIMLLSFLNTQLRDNFDSLDDLLASFQLNRQEIIEKMSGIDYTYDTSVNQFV
ncbi:MAG: DUF4250 domain-containing protein [Roseburia sp.]